MRISFFSFLVTVLTLPLISHSQGLALEVKQQYPAAVIIKVQEINQLLGLSRDKQLAIAKHFYVTDSLVAGAISNGKTDEDIRRIKDSMNTAFRRLLRPGEQDIYFNQQASSVAIKEASLESAYLASKYKINDASKKELYNILYHQRQDYQKVFLQYDGAASADSLLYKHIAANDSVLENYMYAIKGESFLKDELARLQTIQPLAQKDMNRITSEFMNTCLKKKQLGYRDHFLNSLRSVIRDTVYYATLFRDEILQRTNINSQQTIRRLAMENHLTKNGYDAVYACVTGKERSLITYEYAMPFFTRYKDSVINQAARYHDSLITMALMKDGSFPYTSLSTTAIKNREKLQLNSKQVDSLMAGAFTLQKMYEAYRVKNPMGRFNAGPYEANRLPLILTDDQYLMLLEEKNRPQAEEWASKDWAEMKQRGMIDGQDSIAIIHQLTAYNKKRLAAKDLYANDEIKQNAYVNDIDATMPALLRQLKKNRNKATASTLPQQQESTKNTFQW